MNVISFSLWGSDPKYYGGAKSNAELAKTWYPGWSLRVYCEPRHSALMAELGYEVVEREISKGSWEGLFWRFEPVADPSVDLFISRDLDSRLNPREAAAVEEWIGSGKFFHVMRDHVFHDVPILGGLWGCRRSVEFGEMFMAMQGRWPHYERRGRDQEFLAQYIWPTIEHRVLIHDSVHSSPMIHPFPPHPPMIKEIHGTEVGGLVMP